MTNTRKEKIDYYQLALQTIPEIVEKEKVVTDREIKVRLEPIFPWVAGYAKRLKGRTKVVDQSSSGLPVSFLHSKKLNILRLNR